eukprot:s1163_g6.t2
MGTAGLHLPATDRSVHCRTSAASSRSQWALPDFSRDCQIAVGTAGLQHVYMPERMARTRRKEADRSPRRAKSKVYPASQILIFQGEKLLNDLADAEQEAQGQSLRRPGPKRRWDLLRRQRFDHTWLEAQGIGIGVSRAPWTCPASSRGHGERPARPLEVVKMVSFKVQTYFLMQVARGAGVGWQGSGDCLKHCTEPEQCTCLQWFALSTAKAVKTEDVKQGFRFFAKHAHPDKHPNDTAFWSKTFRFGQSCKDYLRKVGNLQKYQERITRLQERAIKRSWTVQQRCESIEDLHEELGISSNGTQSEGLKPRFQKREGPAEKVHLFLDDSGSMSDEDKLLKAKRAVDKIMPRLERTPTAVHFIGDRGHSRQIFALTDDFVFDDIAQKWKAKGGGTFLWEYVYGAVRGAYGHDEEVVIVTDGFDNLSEGKFQGTDGFNHMMRLLKDTPAGLVPCHKSSSVPLCRFSTSKIFARLEGSLRFRKRWKFLDSEVIEIANASHGQDLKRPLPRIVVLCIGNDDCTNGKYGDLALASGGGFFHGESGTLAFVEHMLLTHSERLAKALAQKKKYAQLTPPADRFDWFVPAVVNSKGGHVFDRELETTLLAATEAGYLVQKRNWIDVKSCPGPLNHAPCAAISCKRTLANETRRCLVDQIDHLVRWGTCSVHHVLELISTSGKWERPESSGCSLVSRLQRLAPTHCESMV